MPGIVVILGQLHQPGLAERLDRMLAPLIYRDYASVRAVLPELGIAAGRTGPARCATPQPGRAGDGQILALIEGELPEARALAGRLGLASESAPASVLAACFAQHGARGLESLNGHWAACIVHAQRGEVVIANDPFGVRSLYRARAADGAWLIASHPAALLADPGMPRSLYPPGMADYLAFGYCIGSKTLFHGVEALPGATVLTWSQGNLTTRRYWQPSLRPECSASESELEAIRQLFNESVADLSAISQPSSLALTGGGDSRAILAAMRLAGSRPHTVTHSIPEATDATLAERVAKADGATQHFYEVRGEDVLPHILPGIRLLGGQTSGIDVHPLCFVEDFTRYTRAMFTGLGGNLFKGNDYIVEGLREYNTLPALTGWVLARYNRFLSIGADFPALLTADWLAGVQAEPERSIRDALDAVGSETEMFRRCGVFYLQERVCKHLTKGDAIVRREIETRHPFMHRRLLELVWRVPTAIRDAGLVESYMISKNAPDLARLPFTYEYGDGLPLRPYPSSQVARWAMNLSQRWQVKREELGWHAPQVGNYRWAEWLRGPLAGFFREVLLDPRTQSRPYLRGETIGRWLDEHMAGQDHTLKLGTILSLELTVRELIDQPPAAPPRGVS